MPTSQKYALTITYLPKIRKYGTEEQYARYTHDTIKYIQSKFLGTVMSVVCELTKSYDIHLHGIIQFNMMGLRRNINICRYFRDAFRNHPYIGYVLLKPIEDEVGWINYLQKHIEDFERDVGKQPILIDDYDLLLDYKHFCEIDVNDI